jgi:hypothetical protein
MTDLTGLRKFLGEPTTITLTCLTVGTLLLPRQPPVGEAPKTKNPPAFPRRVFGRSPGSIRYDMPGLFSTPCPFRVGVFRFTGLTVLMSRR